MGLCKSWCYPVILGRYLNEVCVRFFVGFCSELAQDGNIKYDDWWQNKRFENGLEPDCCFGGCVFILDACVPPLIIIRWIENRQTLKNKTSTKSKHILTPTRLNPNQTTLTEFEHHKRTRFSELTRKDRSTWLIVCPLMDKRSLTGNWSTRILFR